MTFNTGNNVPSTDPRDLYDNAENLDKLVNGADPFYADRKGKLRQSWAGMENDFDTAQEGRETAFTLSQADKESRFQAFLVSSGYVSKGDYAEGVVLEERNEYVAVGAATTGTTAGLYRPGPGATLTLTLTGTWATDSANLVLLGDDVLRQELAGEGGSSMIGRGVVAVESIADLLALPADQRRSDLRYLVASYHGGWGVEGPAGGGEFYYDSTLATENNGGTVIEGFVRILAGPVCPTMFGAKGDGLADDGAAFQAVVDLFSDISVTRRTYNLGARSLVIPRDKLLKFNDGRLTRTGAGVILDLVDALYTTVKDLTIVVPAGCTGIRIDSTGTKADSQLNRFYNVNTEGNFSAGSVSLQLIKTWTNQFYSCNFFRTQTGVIFGAGGMAENSCNANHFYGCEVRSSNTYADHTPVIHYGGDNNAFFGGVIENWANAISMQGGTFLLKGVYLEGFAAAYSIEQAGGRLSLDGCFRLGSTNITGGLSFSIRDHHFVAPSGAPTYTADFPFIRVTGNAGVIVSADVEVDPAHVFVIREGYYRESGAWFARTAGVDKVNWHQPKFSARLVSDRAAVTGDGTAYTVNFGDNMEFNDTRGLSIGGVFTAAVAGRFQFQTALWLGGCAVGDTVDLKVTTSGRSYQLYRQRVVTGMLDTSGRLAVGGACFANLAPGHTAVVTLTVSGQASKTVGILRGDAVNAFTAFQGFKI